MIFLFLFLAEVTVLALLDSLPNFFLIASVIDLLHCLLNSDKIADSWHGP